MRKHTNAGKDKRSELYWKKTAKREMTITSTAEECKFNIDMIVAVEIPERV